MLPRDYTRCMGRTPDCPQREDCARHRDIPDGDLTWARNLNVEGIEDCLHFIPYQPTGAPEYHHE